MVLSDEQKDVALLHSIVPSIAVLLYYWPEGLLVSAIFILSVGVYNFLISLTFYYKSYKDKEYFRMNYVTIIIALVWWSINLIKSDGFNITGGAVMWAFISAFLMLTIFGTADTDNFKEYEENTFIKLLVMYISLPGILFGSLATIIWIVKDIFS